ncbi:hypothetical protein L218DRAFT_50192 [Marasmius fiardii PR-910]|nr:hypothetical protein L218DRAFT_50192 [Marasmius fiardii PR-910]
MLKKDEPKQQPVYYQVLDMMVGVHLDAHVMSGYEFLMQNYESGDKICIFGFSRGAYTARALAGMIHKVGPLPRSNYQQVPFAYKMYSRDDEKGWEQSGAFKQAFSIDGYSLDERRARFKPNFWRHQPKDQKNLGLPPGSMPKSKRPPPEKRSSKLLTDLERQYSVDVELATNVEEVWFAGCHCDVGGGAVLNETRSSLARIPLRWTIRQCFISNTGIMFHRGMLKLITANSSMTQGTRIGRFTENFVNEEDEDVRDALSPAFDMLEKKWGWWILEAVPQSLKYQKDDYTWVQKRSWGNWGRPRHIPHGHGVKVHRTVKTRMDTEAETLKLKQKYVPKPKWNFEPVWVG